MPYPNNDQIPKKPKLLLVDDREDNLLSIEAILEPDGYQVTKAYSGHQALKILLAEFDFAMILMDVKMPVLNGFETATLIYERDRLRHIPIIFITANNYGDENIFKGYRAGGIDYIFKPINPEVLRAKVSLFIEIYKKNALLVEQEIKLKAVNENLEKEIHELISSGEKVKQVNARLQKEISDMTSFLLASKLSSDNFVFEESDLNALIKESIHDQVMERKAFVEMEALPKLKVSRILMRPLLQQLIRMELGTAVENPQPTIKIRSEKDPKNSAYCNIIFEDNSSSIEKKVKNAGTNGSSVTRVNGEEKTLSDGLAICRKIMEQHNGFIQVKNAVRGATIIISFPLPQ